MAPYEGVTLTKLDTLYNNTQTSEANWDKVCQEVTTLDLGIKRLV